jgi:LuxR family maltose regulon positive regulatory protein
LPRDQHDAQQFWLAVLDAIRQSAATADSRTRTTPLGFEDDAMVDTIVAELAEHAEVIVLILDDLHELRSADALTQLEYFLANLPTSTRVVLSSRRDPPIRLHQLRLADEVAEIRAGDLRFTVRETHELLAASRISLSDSGAAALYQRTEGWAAGLRLAVISLSGHPDPERFVAQFSGTDRAIGEYLIAEMLERQPSDVQRMLLRTSLVDRLNGDLADLLAGRSGSEQMLLELEDANAFVVSLDAQRTWFRYHQLLADFLRLELRRTMADEFATFTAGPRDGLPTSGKSWRPCDTRSRPATGLTPPGWSQTTRSAGYSTGRRERSTRAPGRFPRARQPIIPTSRWLTRRAL